MKNHLFFGRLRPSDGGSMPIFSKRFQKRLVDVVLPIFFVTSIQGSLSAQIYRPAMPDLPSGVIEAKTGKEGGTTIGGSHSKGLTTGGYSETMETMEYQVHVLGQVNNPGTYRFGPSVRVAEAVGRAGGISERGSMRNLELRRASDILHKVDLFRFYENGDLSANPFLQDNDVIFVPFQAMSVRIEGPVKKSGIYELADETNVWEIIKLAGGFTVGASQESEIIIVRYEDEKKQIIKVANVAEELRRTPIQNGDIIVTPHIFTKGKKFDYAFPNLPTDEVFYPTYNDQIYVAGAVFKPGPYEYKGQLTAFDYINLAGPQPKARIRRMRVITPDGKEIRKVKKYKLSPGDTIVIPEQQMTVGNVLSWYNTFASTLFSYVSLRALIKDL